MRDNGRGFDLSEEFLNLGIKDIDALKKSFASVPMELDELDKGKRSSVKFKFVQLVNYDANRQEIFGQI